MGGPTIKRGESSGDIWTPWIFIKAVEDRFGLIGWDLAASQVSSRAHYTGFFVSEQMDSLKTSWADLPCPHGDFRRSRPLLWLNPPYSNITPWVKKCAAEHEQGAEILLLVPGSIGANWYRDYVEPFADVHSVGRMVFDNCFDKDGKLVRTTYPKDLILGHYNRARGTGTKRMLFWSWRESSTVAAAAGATS